MKPKVGDKISTWFSGQPDGMSIILDVRAYTGRYTELFRWVVTVTAPRTSSGKLKIVVA